jgi:hypothetical protein
MKQKRRLSAHQKTRRPMQTSNPYQMNSNNKKEENNNGTQEEKKIMAAIGRGETWRGRRVAAETEETKRRRCGR